MVDKFFVIPPINNMELALYNNMKSLYCLAHLCLREKNPDYQKYIDFFKGKANQGFHVILDNSAAEADLVTSEVLIELTKEIMPTEVIAPDYLYDREATEESLNKFIVLMVNSGLLDKIQIHAVPQGSNPEEYLSSYLMMLDHPHVDVIGLSKLSVPKSFSSRTDSNSVSVNRRYLVKLLNELGLIKKPLHLLGMRNITEFKAYKGIENIRSTDSCYTILAAMNNKSLYSDEVRDDEIPQTPHNYFFKELEYDVIMRSQSNIDALKKVIEDRK